MIIKTFKILFFNSKSTLNSTSLESPSCLKNHSFSKCFKGPSILVTCIESSDLLSANVDFLTIGQYLQPTVKHFPLNRYVHPDEFKELKDLALSKGFLIVASSPLTRSSYHADEDFSKMKKLREKQVKCRPLQ